MIVSNHIIEDKEIKYRSQDKYLLTEQHSLITANITLQPNNLDGRLTYMYYELCVGDWSMEAMEWASHSKPEDIET